MAAQIISFKKTNQMINTAVIGPGKVGQNYLRALAQDSRVNISAVCGRNRMRTNEIASRYNCQSFCDGNYEQCFDMNLDLILISTPEWEHEGPLLAALKKNIPLIVEKPLLPDWKSSRNILPLLKQHPAPIMPCFTTRFDSRYTHAKQSVDGHTLSFVSSRRNTDYMTASRVFGKIPMTSWIICHDVDLLRWFVNDEIKSVRATSRVPGNPLGPRDFIIAEVRFYNGILGVIENSWASRIGEPKNCEDFRIIAEDGGAELYFSADINHDMVSDGVILKGNTPSMIKHFVDVVAENVVPRVSVSDALASMKACEAIRLSLVDQREVFLTEIAA